MSRRYLEDFAVGQTFGSGRLRIDKEKIKAFATEVLEVRPSRSRSNQGLIKVRTTTLNQNDEAAQVQIANLVVPCRKSGERE
jgi:acyl dehydratase